MPQCDCELIADLLATLLGLIIGTLIADLLVLERARVLLTLRFLSRFLRFLLPVVLYLERLGQVLNQIRSLAEQAEAAARRGTGTGTGGQ